MNDAKKTIPKRRFKEFQNADAWEQCKLSELINDIADGPFGSNLKTIHYTDETEARIVQLSNIGESGWQDDNVRYTTFEHAKEIKRCIVHENELIMAKMMPAGLTIERPNADKMYVLSSDAVRIKLNDTILDSKYFVSMTKSSSFLDQINNDSQGSTRTRTSISKIKEMQISTPILQEQKKIGAFFSEIDNLITLHQHKLEKIKSMKKAYLYEMFPAEGESTPKRRFKGFVDAWEQRKLGELLYLLKDGTHGTHQDLEDGPLLLSAKNIKNGHINWDSSDRRISESEYEKIHSNFTLEKEDILLTIVGSIGETAILKDNYRLTFQRSVAYLRPKSDIKSEFLYSEIQSPRFQKELMNRKSTSAQPGIYLGDLSVIPVSYPKNLEEQKQIGRVFGNLDNLITLHQRKLDKLQNFKKAYLNEMFI